MIPKWSNHLWWIQIDETIVCQLVFMMTLQKSNTAKIRGPFCRCNFYWGTMRNFPLASPWAMNEDMTALTRTAATMDEENSAPVDLLPPTWMKHCTIAPAQQRLAWLFCTWVICGEGVGVGGELMRSGWHRRGNPVIVLKLWHGGYPTLGKGKSSSHVPFLGDMLVPRRGSFFFFFLKKNPTQPNFKFWSFGGSIPPKISSKKYLVLRSGWKFRGNPKVWRKNTFLMFLTLPYPDHLGFYGENSFLLEVFPVSHLERIRFHRSRDFKDRIRSAFAYGHEAAKSNHLSVPWARHTRRESMGEGQGYQSVFISVLLLEKNLTYHLFFLFPPSFFSKTLSNLGYRHRDDVTYISMQSSALTGPWKKGSTTLPLFVDPTFSRCRLRSCKPPYTRSLQKSSHSN